MLRFPFEPKNDPNTDAPEKSFDFHRPPEHAGFSTARPNTSVLKPFEQIVGELIDYGRNKVFQVVTHVP